MAHAEVAIQAGRWEKAELLTLDDRAGLREWCLRTGAGQARTSMSCPVPDTEAADSTTMDLKLTPTRSEESGTVEVKAKHHESRASGLMSGKRPGDC